MIMEKIQFKTNIKCGGCIAQVTPHLDAVAGVEKWEVNIQNPDKILTVVANGANANQVKEAVVKAGFKAEKL
jgi:copper chaperone